MKKYLLFLLIPFFLYSQDVPCGCPAGTYLEDSGIWYHYSTATDHVLKSVPPPDDTYTCMADGSQKTFHYQFVAPFSDTSAYYDWLYKRDYCLPLPSCDENQTLDTSVNPPVCEDIQVPEPDTTTDTDGDGVPDYYDAFPNDPLETKDTDGDGIGDNADPDDNNDGILDNDFSCLKANEVYDSSISSCVCVSGFVRDSSTSNCVINLNDPLSDNVPKITCPEHHIVFTNFTLTYSGFDSTACGSDSVREFDTLSGLTCCYTLLSTATHEDDPNQNTLDTQTESDLNSSRDLIDNNNTMALFEAYIELIQSNEHQTYEIGQLREANIYGFESVNRGIVQQTSALDTRLKINGYKIDTTNNLLNSIGQRLDTLNDSVNALNDQQTDTNTSGLIETTYDEVEADTLLSSLSSGITDKISQYISEFLAGIMVVNTVTVPLSGSCGCTSPSFNFTFMTYPFSGSVPFCEYTDSITSVLRPVLWIIVLFFLARDFYRRF